MIAAVHDSARLSLLLPVLIARKADVLISCSGKPYRFVIFRAIFSVEKVDSQTPFV